MGSLGSYYYPGNLPLLIRGVPVGERREMLLLKETNAVPRPDDFVHEQVKVMSVERDLDSTDAEYGDRLRRTSLVHMYRDPIHDTPPVLERMCLIMDSGAGKLCL